MKYYINIDIILLELESILPKYDDQISLQTVEGNTDPFYGTGRLHNLNHSEEDFCVPLFPELTYTNSVLKELGVFRARVMRMGGKTCYTYHQDPTKRLHIPLITNENCFFVVDDEVIRLPADGSSYLIDTTKKHTFVNASLEQRIHIIGCVNES